MKKIFFLVFTVVSFLSSFAQTGNDTTKYIWYKNAYGTKQPRFWATDVQDVPHDTLHSKTGWGKVGPANLPWWGDDLIWHPPIQLITSDLQENDAAHIHSDGTLFNVHSTNQCQTRIVFGGHFTRIGTSHDFFLDSTVYYIGCTQYIFKGGTVTLDDVVSDPRIDQIIYDASGPTVLKGTEAADPAAVGVNTDDQLLVVTILINADNSIDISNKVLYDEGSEGTNVTTGTANFTSSGNAQNGTNKLDWTAGTNNQYIQITYADTTSLREYSNLIYHIRNIAVLNANRNISVQFYLGNTAVTNEVNLTDNGYTRPINATYQTIIIATQRFTGGSLFNRVRIRAKNNGGTFHQYHDNIYLEKFGGGVVVAPQSDGLKDWYVRNDSVFVNLGGAEVFKYRLYQNLSAHTDQSFVSDSIVTYRLNTASNLTANDWVRGSQWNTSATETVVGTGLEIVNTYSGLFTTNNIAYSKWLSGSNDWTIDATFTVNNVLAGATGRFGVVAYTEQYGGFGNTQYFYVNPKNGTVTYWGGEDILPFAISVGDKVQLKYRRTFTSMFFDVINLTTDHKASYTFVTTNVNTIRKANPGIFVDGSQDVTINDFQFYVRGARPDLLILWDSRGDEPYLTADSTFWGRLQARTSWKISNYAKSSNKLENMTAMLPEIIKIKPRAVFMMGGGVNINQSEDTATWHPKYKKLVDSLIIIGTNVIVGTEFPQQAQNLEPIRDYIYQQYGNNKFVHIIDFWATTPLYDAAGTNKTNATYAQDALHPNNAGVKVFTDSAIKWLNPYVNFIDSVRGGGAAVTQGQLNDSMNAVRTDLGGSGLYPGDSPDRSNGTATDDVIWNMDGHSVFVYNTTSIGINTTSTLANTSDDGVTSYSQTFLTPSSGKLLSSNSAETVVNYFQIDQNGASVSLASGKTFTGGATDSVNYVPESFVQKSYVDDHIANIALGGGGGGGGSLRDTLGTAPSNGTRLIVDDANKRLIFKVTSGIPKFDLPNSGEMIFTSSSGVSVSFYNSSNSDGIVINGQTRAIGTAGGGDIQINNNTRFLNSLDLTGTTAHFGPPNLTTTQRNALSSPQADWTIYCSDCTATDASTGVIQTYNGSTWKNHW